MCGIIGIQNNSEAATLAYMGLYAQQHRGQEGAGVVSSDGIDLHRHMGPGLVSDVFSNSNVFDSASLRASVGGGFGWISPFGPINIDLGFPVLKEDIDITETFRVNFGTRF